VKLVACVSVGRLYFHRCLPANKAKCMTFGGDFHVGYSGCLRSILAVASCNFG